MALIEMIQTKLDEFEQSQFNQRLLNGGLTKGEYAKYLAQQKLIYASFEHRANILPNENLAVIRRIEVDILELQSTSRDDLRITGNTISYIDYMTELSNLSILPHLYINYLILLRISENMQENVQFGTGRMYRIIDIVGCFESLANIEDTSFASEIEKALDYRIAILAELQELNNTNI